ncbi:uncharacterized protein [Macrobrachium rosenbergii]|uniref:uncharacterized protein n=1 Tax=Macrobrachium rosenbergii TaxID=79674 RepID=UPI0034D3AFD8
MLVETLSLDESHSSDNEVHLGDGSTMETEAKSNEEKNNRRHPRRIHEFPGGSPFSIRRYHEKKSRYLSSRPTSLETIIEDVTPSPFFFQDSIIQYSDGREDHRGIRESANLFQVRPEEERDDRKGEEGYFEKNDFGRWEDSAEEDIQQEDMNTLPLRSSRIFRGVIENLNYIFDNDGDGDDAFSANATNFLFQEFYEECTSGKRGSFSSSSSSKCDYGMEERLRDISEKEEEEEEEEEDECSTDTGGASKRSFPDHAHLQSLTEAFIQNHPFHNQVQGKKDVEYPVSLPEINQRYRNSFSSSEESKGNLSLSEPGCERPQVVMAEEWGEAGELEESLRRFYFLKDLSGGSDIEGSCCENLSTSEMTSRIESIDNSTYNIDEGGLAIGPFDPQEFRDTSSLVCDESMGRYGDVSNRILSRTKDDSFNESEQSSGKELDGSGTVIRPVERVEENISSFEIKRTLETEYKDGQGQEESETVKGVGCEDKIVVTSLTDLEKKCQSKQIRKPATDSLRKVSFTVFIQYETIATEIIPKELNTQCNTEKDPDVTEEGQLAVAIPLHETAETGTRWRI